MIMSTWITTLAKKIVPAPPADVCPFSCDQCVSAQADEMRRKKEAAEAEKAQDEAILQSIGEGLIVTDKNGIIIKVNRACEEMLGWAGDEAIGKKITDMIPMENEFRKRMSFEERMVANVLTGAMFRSGDRTPGNTYYVRKDNTRFPVKILLTPFFLANRIVGSVAVFHDMTREHELERAKTDFISLASHQLRTPLAATKWALDLFLEETAGDSRYKARLDDLYMSNERLIELVNSLLDISRIEAGRAVNRISVNLADLVTRACDELRALAEKKGQTIQITLGKEVGTVLVDPLLFHEVVKNLIANSIDYGFPNTTISVGVERTPLEYRISVGNVGPMIPREEREMLFDKFYRGASAQQIKPTGSGLGLYIARTVVEANGGSIQLDASDEHGTRFSFTIPAEH